MTTLDHPRFGKIRYRADEEAWVGWIHLPRFAECRVTDDDSMAQAYDSSELSVEELREKNRLERQQRELATGRFHLSIWDVDQQGPTDAQQHAFDLLIEHEAAALETILLWIVKRYRGCEYWTLDGRARDTFGFHVDSTDELKRNLRLESVRINPDYMQVRGINPITFYFRSPLDDEHGIEVTTIGTEIEDSDAGEPLPDAAAGLPAFPFSLPPTIDTAGIEPSKDGHRFVELRYDNRWSGIFVLDPSLQCVGIVATTLPSPLSDPSTIQDVRAVTRRLRCQLSWRPRVAAMLFVGGLVWLVALPCLILAWVYEPRLYWLCLAIGILAHAVYYFFEMSRRKWLGMATALIVLSIAGLYFESQGLDVENQQRAAAASGVFGGILWWGTSVIAAVMGAAVLGAIVSSRKEVRRDGWSSLIGFSPGLLGVAALVLALIATSSWDWSKLHLLWFTPAVFMGIMLLSIFLPAIPQPTPCPECGKPLASRTAKQCLHCGADWHQVTTE